MQGLGGAFGPAIGARGVGQGADVVDAESALHLGERARDISAAIIGHPALDFDAALPEPARALTMKPVVVARFSSGSTST